jgi:iron complex outermembrane receptor protein
VLEPLVVVGERATASVLLGNDLHLLQAHSLAGLSGALPGFNVVTSDTRGYGDIISMRGSANTLYFSPAAVGMVIDDVPQGEVFSYPGDLLELASVRLLRGPQGAAFGRNGAAGMIEMTTPLPGDRLHGALTLEGGSYDAWGGRLSTGGPLGGGVSHTLQLYHQQRDGFINDLTLGRAIDDRSLTGGLANLFWQAAPDTELRLRVFAERADDGAQRLSSLASPDPFEVRSNEPGRNETDRLQVSLHWTQNADWGRFKSITSWQEWKLDPSVTDLDFMDLGPVFNMRSTIYQDQRLWSQELRWESPEDRGPWAWRTGLFWMDQTYGGDATREFPVQPFPNFWMPYAERTVFDIDQTTIAGYGRLAYQLDDRTELQGGTRVEYFGASIDRTKTGLGAPPNVVREDLDAWYVSPELGFSRKLDDCMRGFARSALGVKPAGFSAFASPPNSARYDEELGWNNELGLEASMPEERLEFALTAFYNRISDYQLNRQDTVSTDYLTVNAERVSALGLEAQARWRPCDALTLQAAAGWVRTEFDDYYDPLRGERYDGNSVPYIPEFSGSLGLRYDLPKGFYAQTALRVNGPTYFDEANSSAFRQDAYWVWDAELGYASGPFSVAVFGRNLTDEGYYTFINPQIRAGAPGDPQLFGVRATVTF